MTTWQCVSNCGACCFLDPSGRPDLEDYLAPDQLAHYLSLVGDDGWCIHYKAETRTCGIYDTRPDFCRVTPHTFQTMFGIAPEDLSDFAIDCCQQHIADHYGDPSTEMQRFNQAVGWVDPAEKP